MQYLYFITKFYIQKRHKINKLDMYILSVVLLQIFISKKRRQINKLNMHILYIILLQAFIQKKK